MENPIKMDDLGEPLFSEKVHQYLQSFYSPQVVQDFFHEQ